MSDEYDDIQGLVNAELHNIGIELKGFLAEWENERATLQQAGVSARNMPDCMYLYHKHITDEAGVGFTDDEAYRAYWLMPPSVDVLEESKLKGVRFEKEEQYADNGRQLVRIAVTEQGADKLIKVFAEMG